MRVIRPLVWAIDMLDNLFGQQTLQIAEKDNIILAVEVDPTVVAVLGIVTLSLTCRLAVEDFIE